MFSQRLQNSLKDPGIDHTCMWLILLLWDMTNFRILCAISLLALAHSVFCVIINNFKVFSSDLVQKVHRIIEYVELEEVHHDH